jgi:hypothetical protein
MNMFPAMQYSLLLRQPEEKLRDVHDTVEELLSYSELLPADLRIKLDTFSADITTALEDRQSPANEAQPSGELGAHLMTDTETGHAIPPVVLTVWANSRSRTRRIAAALARELANANPGDRVESPTKIAGRFGVTNSVAANARYLLMGQKVICKVGRHYYVV